MLRICDHDKAKCARHHLHRCQVSPCFSMINESVRPSTFAERLLWGVFWTPTYIVFDRKSAMLHSSTNPWQMPGKRYGIRGADLPPFVLDLVHMKNARDVA